MNRFNLNSFFYRLLIYRLSTSAWLTLIYLFISVSWILWSDSLVISVAGNDPSQFEILQSVKGIFFVSLSGILLYFVSRKLNRGIQNSRNQELQTEKKFHVLNETSKEGIYDFNITNGRARLNNKMKFFFPSESNEIQNFWETYRNRVHPADIHHVEEEFRDTAGSHRNSWQTELRLLGNDNNYYNVICSNYLIRNPVTGRPEELIGTVLDVSALRNLQAENYEQKLKHKRTLASSIIRAQENERNRWAQELHDNVCQILAVANMYAVDITKNPEKSSELAPEIQKLVSESLKEIRQLSASIKTHSFVNETLRMALEKLIANINRVNPISFELISSDFNESKVCPEQKLLIYRVVQEQFNNILKYAGASMVKVNIAISDNENVDITISDNGKGFESSKVNTGIGLQNIRSRLQVYGGSMHINTAPGMGCRLSATFKIKES